MRIRNGISTQKSVKPEERMDRRLMCSIDQIVLVIVFTVSAVCPNFDFILLVRQSYFPRNEAFLRFREILFNLLQYVCCFFNYKLFPQIVYPLILVLNDAAYTSAPISTENSLCGNSDNTVWYVSMIFLRYKRYFCVMNRFASLWIHRVYKQFWTVGKLHKSMRNIECIR